MNPEDAEEYTQALGQVASGTWRQVALGQRLGVPQALGLTVTDWVQGRLGGYARLNATERREAVQELTAPEGQGGMGLSQRKAAQVLGVGLGTVNRDLETVPNGTPENAPAQVEPVATVPNGTPDQDWVALQWLRNLREYCRSLDEGLKDEKRITQGLAAGGKLPSVQMVQRILNRLEKLEAAS